MLTRAGIRFRNFGGGGGVGVGGLLQEDRNAEMGSHVSFNSIQNIKLLVYSP